MSNATLTHTPGARVSFHGKRGTIHESTHNDGYFTMVRFDEVLDGDTHFAFVATEYLEPYAEPHRAGAGPAVGERESIVPAGLTPPEGFVPNYDCTYDPETLDAIPDESTITCYDGPVVGRPGYAIDPIWTEEDGCRFWINHENDDPFTLGELRDLVGTLQSLLVEHGDS